MARTCPYCESTALMKNGHTTTGQQWYICRTCGRQHREHPQANGYTAEEPDTTLRAYEERSSLRGLTRTFGVSRTTVLDWVKKPRDCRRCIQRFCQHKPMICWNWTNTGRLCAERSARLGCGWHAVVVHIKW